MATKEINTHISKLNLGVKPAFGFLMEINSKDRKLLIDFVKRNKPTKINGSGSLYESSESFHLNMLAVR